jgi:hypothetical protein
VSSTTAGNITFGVDLAVTAGAATTQSNVYHHTPSVMSDVKQRASITFTGGQALKTEPKSVIAQSGLDEDELSFGVFQCYLNGPVSTAMGYIEVTTDISFIGPC